MRSEMAKERRGVARSGQEHAWLASAWSTVVRVFQVAEQRRKLAQLDERALSDIGITRSQAEFEAGRAPWDLPARNTERDASAATGRARGDRPMVKCPG